MRHLRPYHFTRPRFRGAREFCRRVRECDGAICFDLEDSVYSADPTECRAMKDRRRGEVMALLSALGDDPGLPEFFVRVNAPGTADYDLDLQALRTLRSLPGIFLPKAESAEEVRGVLQAFPKPPPSLIPVLESRAGLATLSAILAEAHPSFTDFAFGHCDYNFDCGHFPFYHQDAEEYWSWIARLDTAARASGKGMVNSPVLRLDDEELFLGVLDRLAHFPTVRGQVTLSLRQTQQCAASSPAAGSPAASRRKPPLRGSRATNEESARRVVQEFERHRVEGGYFALDEERTVISPQEYRAAQRFHRP